MALFDWFTQDDQERDRALFERTIEAFEANIINAGAHGMIDGHARVLYQQRISAMAAELRAQATSGRISWAQAAEEANEARNGVMDLLRNRSTPVGRAWAESIKREGRTLNELIARYAVRRFGENVNFEMLSQADKDRVYLDVVEAAGRDNPRVSQLMRRLSRAGRGLVILSVAVSVYSVATADDKAAAATREIAVGGAGIAGGIGGGMLAGLACGPGAPVCVAIGAFAGGALAAFGVDMFWD